MAHNSKCNANRIALSVTYLALYATSVGYRVADSQKQVREAFISGDLQNGWWLSGNTAIGVHQFNDCLILLQAIDQRAASSSLRVSPIAQNAVSGTNPCIYLRGFSPKEALTRPYFYHRYLHGHTMLARFLLPYMSVNMIRSFYQTLINGALVTGLAIALRQIARGRDRGRGTAWALTFAILTRYFGVESFGQSLGHGPSDLVDTIFLLFLCFCWSRGGLALPVAIKAAAAFGALTMIFEFLTGGIPLGASILIGALPLALRPDLKEKAPRIVGYATLAYGIGIAISAGTKIILLLLTFGFDPLREAGNQLALRMAHSAAGEASDGSITAFLSAIVQGLNSLAAGGGLLVFAMLMIAAPAGSWAHRALTTRPPSPFANEARLLVLSILPPISWLVIFWQHSIVHARFMDRILVWLIIAPFILFALAIGNDANLENNRSTE